MLATIGKTKVEVDMYAGPDGNEEVVDTIAPNVTVKVLSEDGDWLCVRPLGSASGYVPRSAILILEGMAAEIFPLLGGESGQPDIPSLPGWVKAADLVNWLATDGKPPWIPDGYWNILLPIQQQGIIEAIKQSITDNQQAWDGWLLEIKDGGRQDEATIDEWLTILIGGKNMWSLKTERVFHLASEKSELVGWIKTNEIIKWTGHVKLNKKEAYKTWYEVQLEKFKKDMKGWYKAALLDEYILPTPANDPDIEQNTEKVFDLTVPLMRVPDDQEIKDAIKAGYSAAQYINLVAVVGHNLRHFNLCGEFCVATLGGQNVIPSLKKWKIVYPRAKRILEDPGEGTNTLDLRSMLAIFNLPNAEINYKDRDEMLLLISPKRLREKLHNGKMMIAGVGIKSNGRLHPQGNIRHWVVVEDVIPVGNNGWVRLYNPFNNRDEVYPFKLFSVSMGTFGRGLWVDHPRRPQN